MTALDDDRLVSLAEAATYLGVSKKSIYAWRARGIGPRGFRLHGGLVRFRLSDLRDWVDAQAAESPSTTTGRDGSV